MSNVAFIHTNKNFTLLALNLWDDQSTEYDSILFEGIWTCSKERQKQLVEVLDGVVNARGATFASVYRFIERAGIFTDKDYRPKKTKSKNINIKEHNALIVSLLKFMNSQYQKAGYGDYKVRAGTGVSAQPLSYLDLDNKLATHRITRASYLFDGSCWPNPSITDEIDSLCFIKSRSYLHVQDVVHLFSYMKISDLYNNVVYYYPRTIHAVQDEYINRIKKDHGLEAYYEKENVQRSIVFNAGWIPSQTKEKYFYECLTRKEVARYHMSNIHSLCLTRFYRIPYYRTPSSEVPSSFFHATKDILQLVQAEFNEKNAAKGLYLKAMIHEVPLSTKSTKPINDYYHVFGITFQVFLDTYIDENCEFKPLFEDGVLLPEAQEYMNNNLY